MLKKLTAATALLALCLMTSVAFAGVMSFPKFKVNVPDGWEASQEGSTVVLVASDKSASISITVDETKGASIKDLATAFSKELKGGALTPVPDSDGFHFTFKSGAVESNAILASGSTAKEYILFVITGENPQIDKIIDSLEDK